MNHRQGRTVLGLILTIAGAALNAQMLVDWMRNSGG